MKDMVGFVQRARRQLCIKTQKLGQIGEMWRMRGEILEKWGGVGYSMEE